MENDACLSKIGLIRHNVPKIMRISVPVFKLQKTIQTKVFLRQCSNIYDTRDVTQRSACQLYDGHSAVSQSAVKHFLSVNVNDVCRLLAADRTYLLASRRRLVFSSLTSTIRRPYTADVKFPEKSL